MLDSTLSMLSSEAMSGLVLYIADYLQCTPVEAVGIAVDAVAIFALVAGFLFSITLDLVIGRASRLSLWLVKALKVHFQNYSRR